MNGIENDYNMPVLAEQVSGQSIAGPAVGNTESQIQETNNIEQNNPVETEKYKGQHVDTRA